MQKSMWVPWMLVILVLKEEDAKTDSEVQEFLGLIPVKEEAGREPQTETLSDTCERRGEGRVSDWGAALRKSWPAQQGALEQGLPTSGFPYCTLKRVKLQNASPLPSLAAELPGEIVPVASLNAVTDLEATTEGW